MEEKKKCSKCGKEVFLGFYVERKRLFSSKKKRWCFSCYNKLKFGAGKLELKEVVITGERVPVPKENDIPEIRFTSIDDVRDFEEE